MHRPSRASLILPALVLLFVASLSSAVQPASARATLFPTWATTAPTVDVETPTPTPCEPVTPTPPLTVTAQADLEAARGERFDSLDLTAPPCETATATPTPPCETATAAAGITLLTDIAVTAIETDVLTVTASASPGPTATPTQCATLTATVSSTPSRTPTGSATPSPTQTATSSATASATPSRTWTQTPTPSRTPTTTPSVTASATSTQTPTPTPTATPPQVVVVIPGTIGTQLNQPSDGARLWVRLNPLLLRRLSLETNPNLLAVDILRRIDLANEGEGLLDGQPVYQPLLDALGQRFIEYIHNNNRYLQDGRPERITRAGCDVHQVDRLRRKPTLFIFPYDWRKDNALSAAHLKEYVVDCIQRIHPGAKVDIVAHSMGGLIARRMILDTEAVAPGPHPLVRRLITAGSPFWGAPKANYMMETGDIFGLPRVSAVFGYFSPLTQIMRVTARDFPSVHQLLPSKAFFDNAPANRKPFGEGGPGLLGLGEWRYWDINRSGQREDDYTYNTYKAMMDTNRPFSAVRPMTVNERFHGHANQFGSKQDDWANDTTGVEYFHLVGVDKSTPVKVRAMTLTAAINIDLGRFRANLAAGSYFIFEYKSGDGTVPRLSAERTRATNAPRATIQVFSGFDHMELAAKKEALDCILRFLGFANVCQRSAPIFQAGLVPASRHIVLANVQNVRTLDAGGSPLDLNGVALPAYGETTANLAIPAGQAALIYFHTLSQPEMPVMARLMTTDGAEADVRKTLYFDPLLRNDLPLLPSEDMLGLLAIDSLGGTRLQFDWNRDGVINGADAIVPPTVDSTDPGLVMDELGPAIWIGTLREENGTRYVTLEAADPSGILADTGVGTPPFLVSLENDGTVIDNLVKYTPGSAVAVPAGQHALTACAVDGAGNRLCELFVIP